MMNNNRTYSLIFFKVILKWYPFRPCTLPNHQTKSKYFRKGRIPNWDKQQLANSESKKAANLGSFNEKIWLGCHLYGQAWMGKSSTPLAHLPVQSFMEKLTKTTRTHFSTVDCFSRQTNGLTLILPWCYQSWINNVLGPTKEAQYQQLTCNWVAKISSKSTKVLTTKSYNG